MSHFVDSHTRSIAKAISYRALGFAVTAFVAFVITGKAGLATAIGLSDTAVKFAGYYLHERAWNRIRFGQVRPPEYEI